MEVTKVHRRDAAPVRAARGARWLDERMPGWHEIVNPATVDVESTRLCVIAQLGAGSFGRGVDRVDPTDTADLKALGFFGSYHLGRCDAPELDAAWIAEINTRRYGTAVPPRSARVRLFWQAVRRALARR